MSCVLIGWREAGASTGLEFEHVVVLASIQWARRSYLLV